jgi:hypothetical protein
VVLGRGILIGHVISLKKPLPVTLPMHMRGSIWQNGILRNSKFHWLNGNYRKSYKSHLDIDYILGFTPINRRPLGYSKKLKKHPKVMEDNLRIGGEVSSLK